MEMRSREPTVADDLPPWCRMTVHEYLGTLPGVGCMRYFVRRGQPTEEEEKALDKDKEKAKDYEWRVRARGLELVCRGVDLIARRVDRLLSAILGARPQAQRRSEDNNHLAHDAPLSCRPIRLFSGR